MVGWRDWILWAVLVAVVTGAFFGWGVGDYPLWDVDEARHAEVAREMTLGHGVTRFLLPTFGSEPYREKPPGYYWLVAASFALGGVSAAAARLVNVLAGLVTVVALYVFAARRDGPAAGLGAALVTASCLGFAGLARYANLDMVLTACVTLGVLTGLAWLEAPSPRRRLTGPYIAAALAVLVKGPIGIVLVAVPLGLAGVVSRAAVGWRELSLVRGFVIMVVLVGLPSLAIATLDPAYGYGLVATNLRRFGADAPHPAPVYSYALWFPLLVAPWTVLAVPMLWRAFRDATQWPALAWLVVVLALFSVPSGKLATYVLPALPPFGLLVGPALARAIDQDDDDDEPEDLWLRVGGWVHVVLLAVAAVGATVAGMMGDRIGTALVAIGVAGWWMALTVVALRRDRARAVPALVLASVLTGVPPLISVVAPIVSAQHSDADAAALAQRVGVRTVVAFRSKSPSLLFYSPVPVVHVDDPNLLRELFAGKQPVMVVTGSRHMMEVERALGNLAHRWLDRGRRQTYGNRPLPAG
jgi:4-amino-4-deoxy-L-arabinose transferase-like glycosyltransferase